MRTFWVRIGGYSSPPSLLRLAIRSVALLLLVWLVAGCATPVGVTMVSLEDAYRLNTANPVNQGVLSNSAREVLHRYNLLQSFADEPLQAIRTLQETAAIDGRRDLLFTLAEVSFLLGERLRKMSGDDRKASPDAYLLAAVYAYFYLLGEGNEPPPTPFDHRFRAACDLYNRALAYSFPADDDEGLNLSGGVRTLPSGTLTVIPTAQELHRELNEFEKLLPADAYAVRGFSVRNRTSGMGLPLIGVTRTSPESPEGGCFPLTAFLRINGGVRDFANGSSSAFLEFYSTFDDTSVTVNGRTVPLEIDSTAPLAYLLTDDDIWSRGPRQFLGKRIDNHLIFSYERGRIPVVFVHGTASSPVWWAEMFNTLRADPTLRRRFQFWMYQYNSSNRLLQSAAELRETLTKTVNRLDPLGTDPALRQMVIIGHSQGGLLTRTTAVAPGDKLWKSISDLEVDELETKEDLRKDLRRSFFFEPLPFVTRTVFISTPHRGSFMAKEWIRNLVRRFVALPIDINTEMGLIDQLNLPPSLRQLPTSIDNMSTESPDLQILATLPLAPGVTGHSIIAVLPDMPIESGNDGVVEYRSAHLEGMASEFIVRTGHSCQGHPLTIEEVRRILREHIGDAVVGPKDIQTLRQPDGTHPPEPFPPSPPAPVPAPAVTSVFPASP